QVVRATTFGFAYAGATLPAMATHALASIACSHLKGQKGSPAPALNDVVLITSDIAAYYMKEIGAVRSTAALFSAIVFGWCLRDGKFKAFELSPSIASDTLSVKIVEHDMDVDQNLVVIGSCPDLLRQRIVRDRPTFYAGPDGIRPEMIILREIDLP